jgi:hypothetical protein
MSFTIHPVRPEDHDGLLDRLRDRLPGRPSSGLVSAGTLVQMLAGLLVLVLIGVALTVHLQTRADLHRTQRELTTTQGQLASTKAIWPPAAPRWPTRRAIWTARARNLTTHRAVWTTRTTS